MTIECNFIRFDPDSNSFGNFISMFITFGFFCISYVGVGES